MLVPVRAPLVMRSGGRQREGGVGRSAADSDSPRRAPYDGLLRRQRMLPIRLRSHSRLIGSDSHTHAHQTQASGGHSSAYGTQSRLAARPGAPAAARRRHRRSVLRDRSLITRPSDPARGRGVMMRGETVPNEASRTGGWRD